MWLFVAVLLAGLTPATVHAQSPGAAFTGEGWLASYWNNLTLSGAPVLTRIDAALAGSGVAWEFRYLAGRPDRALTHLARAVDAAVIVVGTGRPGRSGRFHGLLDAAVGTHLVHHQHRPVLTVPTSVVDWRTPLEWR